MKSFRVTYRTESHFGFAKEIIEARGIMHACKLAVDHCREMRKTLSNSEIQVYTVKEILADD